MSLEGRSEDEHYPPPGFAMVLGGGIRQLNDEPNNFSRPRRHDIVTLDHKYRRASDFVQNFYALILIYRHT